MRVGGDAGELRQWRYIHVHSIESRLIMGVIYDRGRGDAAHARGRGPDGAAVLRTAYSRRKTTAQTPDPMEQEQEQREISLMTTYWSEST